MLQDLLPVGIGHAQISKFNLHRLISSLLNFSHRIPSLYGEDMEPICVLYEESVRLILSSARFPLQDVIVDF